MADHRHGVRARLVPVLLRGEHATERRCHAQDLEVVPGDEFAPYGLGMLRVAEAEHLLAVDRQPGERFQVLAILAIIDIGDLVSSVRGFGSYDFQHRQLVAVAGTREWA
jgi:hypothetical protein